MCIDVLPELRDWAWVHASVDLREAVLKVSKTRATPMAHYV